MQDAAKKYYYGFIKIITIVMFVKFFCKDGLKIFGEFPEKPKQLSVI